MRIVIAGTGITVYFLAKKFASKGYNISIISDSLVDCEYYSKHLKALVINGKFSDPELLTQAQAHTAEIFIGMTSRDQDNLVLCQMAKEFYQIPRILAVVNDPDNEEVFSKIGIRAISNCRFLIETIENMSDLDTIKQQISVVEGKVIITEMEISADARVVGKSLSQIPIPMSVLITTIIRGEDVIIPQGSTVIEAKDRLLILCLPDNQSVALRIFA